MQHHTPEESREIRRVVLKLQGKAWGVAVGLLLGLGLFIATMILVLMGGPNPGPHLRLLGEFLPGYRVTIGGAFLGFVYMFVIGYALGRLIGTVYNRLAYTGD
jgi:hypothetical protein